MDDRFLLVDNLDYLPKQDYIDSHIAQSEKCYRSKLLSSDFSVSFSDGKYLLACIFDVVGLTIIPGFIYNELGEIEDYDWSKSLVEFSCCLEHYLSGSGENVIFSEEEMKSLIFSQQSNMDHYYYNINQLINCVESTISTDAPKGTKIVLATKSSANFLLACYTSEHCNFNSLNTPSLIHESTKVYDNVEAFDWSQAVGNAFGTMVAEVTYLGDNAFKMEYNYNLYDIYEFGYHYGDIDPFDDFHELHEQGKAKDFFMCGTYHSYVSWKYGDDYMNPRKPGADYSFTNTVIINDDICR